jgi:hypothetical protein
MPSKRLWTILVSLIGALAFTILILVGNLSRSFTGTSAALAAAGLFALAVSILLQTN